MLLKPMVIFSTELGRESQGEPLLACGSSRDMRARLGRMLRTSGDPCSSARSKSPVQVIHANCYLIICKRGEMCVDLLAISRPARY